MSPAGPGFIGCAISASLAEAFDRVVVVDSLHPQIHATGERPAELDARAEQSWPTSPRPRPWDTVLAQHSPDVVIHLAAETGTGSRWKSPTRHTHVNVVGALPAAGRANRHGKLPRRIVCPPAAPSTARRLAQLRRPFYGPAHRHHEPGPVGLPRRHTAADEGLRDVPRPVSVYGATSWPRNTSCEAWAKSYGVETVILRLQNVYGPGQSLINPYTGIMSLFCRMAMGGKSIPLYEDGEVRRDFILIDDVASAIVAGAVSPTVKGEPMDIGSVNSRPSAPRRSSSPSTTTPPAARHRTVPAGRCPARVG